MPGVRWPVTAGQNDPGAIFSGCGSVGVYWGAPCVYADGDGWSLPGEDVSEPGIVGPEREDDPEDELGLGGVAEGGAS